MNMRTTKFFLGGLALMLVAVGLVSFVLGTGCSSGWIQLKLGDSAVCTEPAPELPCPDPKICVWDVVKLVSVEAYPVQARLERVNQPDLGDWLDPIWSRLGLEEKFVILAYGRVVAGFDLQKLRDEDVWSDGKHIRIQLPPPEILYEPNIDHSRTQIISESGFCPDLVCPESIELAGPALIEAQAQMRTASIEELKILDRAAASARESLDKFFRLLGYEEVEILIDQHPL